MGFWRKRQQIVCAVLVLCLGVWLAPSSVAQSRPRYTATPRATPTEVPDVCHPDPNAGAAQGVPDSRGVLRLNLVRECNTNGCTIGSMYDASNGQLICRTLELLDRGNMKMVSCIPGNHRYLCELTSSKKFPSAWEVRGGWLDGRTNIKIHGTKSGSATSSNSLGCIVVGSAVNDDNSGLTGTIEAFNQLMWYTGKAKSLLLTVEDETSCPPTPTATPTAVASPTQPSNPHPIG